MNANDFFNNNGQTTVKNPKYDPNNPTNGEPENIIAPYTEAYNPVLENMNKSLERQQTVDNKDVEKYNKHGLMWSPWSDNLDSQLADRQSWVDQLGNSLVQTIGSEIVLGTALGFANFFDWAMNLALEEENDYSSPVSDFILDLQKQIREATPIYQDPNKTWSDSGWWFANIPSVASTLSLLLPAKGVTTVAGKVLGGLGKIGRASQRAKAFIGNWKTIQRVEQGSELFTMGIIQRLLENYQEANQVYADMLPGAVAALEQKKQDGTYNDYISRHQERFANIDTNDINAVAKQIATDSADETFYDDWINVGFDIWQLYALKNAVRFMNGTTRASVRRAHINSMKRIGKTEQELGAMDANRTWKQKAGEKLSDWTRGSWIALTAELNEGVEEAVNFVAQQEGMRYGKFLLEQDVNDKYTTFWSDRLLDYMAAPGLWESAFWGVMGGITFQAVGSGINRLERSIETSRRLSKIEDPKTKEELANRSWFMQTKEIEDRVNDIKFRETAFNNMKAKIDQINRGEDPDRIDENKKHYKLETEAEKEIARKRVLQEYTNQLLTNSMFTGNFNLTREFLQSNAVKEALVKTGVLTREQADARQQEIKAIADNLVDSYNRNMSAVSNALLHYENKKLADIPFEYWQLVAAQNMRHEQMADRFKSHINETDNVIDSEETRLKDELEKINVAGVNAERAVRFIALQQALGTVDAEIEAIEKTKGNNKKGIKDSRKVQTQAHLEALHKRKQVIQGMIQEEFKNNPFDLATGLMVNIAAKGMMYSGRELKQAPKQSVRFQEADAKIKEMMAYWFSDETEMTDELNEKYVTYIDELFGWSGEKGKHFVAPEAVADVLSQYGTINDNLRVIFGDSDITHFASEEAFKTFNNSTLLAKLGDLSLKLQNAYATKAYLQVERAVEQSKVLTNAKDILISAQQMHNFDAGSIIRAGFVEAQVNTLKRIARDHKDNDNVRQLLTEAMTDKHKRKQLKELLSENEYLEYNQAIESLAISKPINSALPDLIKKAIYYSYLDDYVDAKNKEAHPEVKESSSTGGSTYAGDEDDDNENNTPVTNEESPISDPAKTGKLIDSNGQRVSFAINHGNDQVISLYGKSEDDFSESNPITQIGQWTSDSFDTVYVIEDANDPMSVELDFDKELEKGTVEESDAIFQKPNSYYFDVKTPLGKDGAKIITMPRLTFDADGNVTAMSKGTIAVPGSVDANNAIAFREKERKEGIKAEAKDKKPSSTTESAKASKKGKSKRITKAEKEAYQKEKIIKSQHAIAHILSQQHWVRKEATDAANYYIEEKQSDGTTKIVPYPRVHSVLPNNFEITELQKGKIQEIVDAFKQAAKEHDNTYISDYNISELDSYLEQLDAGTITLDTAIRDVEILAKDKILGTSSFQSLKGGTAVDTVIRDYFNNDGTTTRPKNMTESAYNQLLTNLTAIKEEIDRRGERFLANNLVLFVKDGEKRVAGEIDILAVAADGTLVIYDVKTSTRGLTSKNSNFNKSFNGQISTKEYYRLQLSAYKNMFEAMTGVTIEDLALIPFKLTFNNAQQINNIELEKKIKLTYNPAITDLVPNKTDNETADLSDITTDNTNSTDESNATEEMPTVQNPDDAAPEIEVDDDGIAVTTEAVDDSNDTDTALDIELWSDEEYQNWVEYVEELATDYINILNEQSKTNFSWKKFVKAFCNSAIADQKTLSLRQAIGLLERNKENVKLFCALDNKTFVDSDTTIDQMVTLESTILDCKTIIANTDDEAKKTEATQRKKDAVAALHQAFDQMMDEYLSQSFALSVNGKKLVSLEAVLDYCIATTGNEYLARFLYEEFKGYFQDNSDYVLFEKKEDVDNAEAMFDKVKQNRGLRHRTMVDNARRINIQFFLKSNELSDQEKNEIIKAFNALKPGDRLEYRTVDDGKAVEITVNGVPIGRQYVPSIDYIEGKSIFDTYISNWHTQLYISEESSSHVEDFFVALFSNANNEDEITNILTKLYNTGKSNKQPSVILADIMKTQLWKEYTTRPDGSAIELVNLNKDNADVVAGYLVYDLFNAVTKESFYAKNEKEADAVVRRAIHSWFEGIRQSYLAAVELKNNPNKVIRVDYVNDGGLNLDEKGNLRSVADNKAIAQTHREDLQLAAASTEDNTVFFSNGTSMQVFANQYNTGSTFVAIKKADGSYALAHAYPITIGECRGVAKDIQSDVVNYLMHLLRTWNKTPNNENLNAIFNFVESLTGADSTKHHYLFQGIKVIKTKQGYRQILYNDADDERHSIRFYFSNYKNRRRRRSAVIQFDNEKAFAFESDNRKLDVEKRLTEIFNNNLYFNLAFDHLRNHKSPNGAIATVEDGKFIISLPHFNKKTKKYDTKVYEYNSMRDFFVNNGLLKVTTKVNKTTGTNFKGCQLNAQSGENALVTFEIVDETSSTTDNVVSESSAEKTNPVEEKKVGDQVKETLVTNPNTTANDISKMLLNTSSALQTLNDSGILSQIANKKVIFAPKIESNGAAIAAYSSKTNSITLSDTWIALANSDPNQAFRHLMHECIHAQIADLDITKRQKLFNEMREIFKQWSTFSNNNSTDIIERYFKIDGRFNTSLFTDGNLTDRGIEEFIVESLTRPEIIKSLNQSIIDPNATGNFGDIKAKNLFQKMLSVIAKLFNLDLNKGSLLEKEYKLFDEIGIDPSNTTKNDSGFGGFNEDAYSVVFDNQVASVNQIRDSLYYDNRVTFDKLLEQDVINFACRI
jgi:hypothetical protein